LVLLAVAAAASFAEAQVNVTTYHYDNSRTGQNTNETILTPSNVTVSRFGKLFAQPVDGQVFAQPLYMQGVAISGKGTHNILIVATENDSVYAFDADNNTGANASPLWKASLIDAADGATPMQYTDIGCSDIQTQTGITSTPVIDTTSGTIYVEAKSREHGSFIHRLHALDVTTGSEKSVGPVVIKEPINFTPTFNSLHQLNRAGLLLMSGTIFIAFASHCDFNPYNGWLFAYDATTLTQKGVFNATPSSVNGRGGIWMSGAGLAADRNGNIYVATGNGTFSQNNPLNLGDSILKFNFSNGTLSVADYFTPYNENALNMNDADLGSGGVLLLPDQPGTHPHLLVAGGKQGRIYLLDRDQLTSNPSNPDRTQPYCSGCSSDPQIVQESISGQVGGMWSMPAYWNNHLYFWGSSDVLKSIPLTNGRLDFTHLTSSIKSYGYPGATPSISANGTANGIVWSIDSGQFGTGAPSTGPAVLHAHDASNLSNSLWSSAQAAYNRDRAGNAVKFTVPVVANGKVYIGTSAEVDVYGLFKYAPPAPPTITMQPDNQMMTPGQTATFKTAAIGSPTPTVQWQVSTGIGETFSIIPGATSTTLSFTTALFENGNQYRAVFTNSAGTAATTGATLTVNSAPSSTWRDDFNSSALDPSWSFAGVGNSNYSLTANPGHLQVSVPAGSGHDCWNTTLGCARMLRSVSNTDASYETKIDGVNIGAAAQTYGIFLQQDDANFLRFEFWTNGSGVRPAAWKNIGGIGSNAIYGPVITLGSSNYLRVTRTGSTFQLDYSTNGATWVTAGSFTQAGFSVNKAGLHVDNAGGSSAPATTANFDYFAVAGNSAPSSTWRDDFNSSALDPSWSFAGVGNSNYSLTANPGHLQMNVPAGSDHNCWNTTLGCARMLRSVSNTDASYETKIDGVNIGAAAQTYGIFLQQDNANFLRFEFWTNGSGVRPAAWKNIGGIGSNAIYGPVITLGSSNYLRVTRTGSTFQLDYSTNGTTWVTAGSFTQAGFSVNKAGLHVDNAGGSSAPATTGNFDYFQIH
jgi:hypothetical protein